MVGIPDVDSLEKTAVSNPSSLAPIALRSVLAGAKNETSGTQLRSIGMWAARMLS
jgi:hypothetical protein